MKKLLLFAFIFGFSAARAQKIDSIYVNLYTDSLKKGTFNYINIDGKLSDGRYLPLDSNHLIFSSSYGTFHGNTLWIDSDCKVDKVAIRVVMKNNHAISKDFVMYVKKMEDNEHLKTQEDILNEIRGSSKKKIKKKSE